MGHPPPRRSRSRPGRRPSTSAARVPLGAALVLAAVVAASGAVQLAAFSSASASFRGPRHQLSKPRTSQRAGAEAADWRTWQRRLDKALLDVDAPPLARLRNLQKALRDPAAIVQDFWRAVGAVVEKGPVEGQADAIDVLWPQGTTARADVDGLAALRRQLPELLEDFQSRETLRSSSGASQSGVGVGDVLASLTSLGDPAKQKALLEEAKNIFRRTPKGLEQPSYTVVRELAGGVELRRYEPFTVAQRTMPDSSGTAYSSAEGFTSLARYLFGENSEKTAMEMTMPVEINYGSRAKMAFVLPKSFADAPPTPDDATVELVSIPERLVAAKPFAGVATAGEVERQRASLMQTLEAEGFAPQVVDADKYSVLQYNPPYTLPWRRRNELALVLQQVETPDSKVGSKELERSEYLGTETAAEDVVTGGSKAQAAFQNGIPRA